MKLKRIIENIKRVYAIRRAEYPPITREYIVDSEKKVAYLVNSKAACSSIKVSMYRVEIADNDSVHHIQDNRLFIDGFFSEPGFFIFTYVRSPFTRLVSCYESKYHNDKKRIGKGMQALQFDDYLDGFMRYDSGFFKFLIKVALIPRQAADRHFCSQYHLIYDNGRPMVDFVGKIEEMGSYDRIAEKYGFDPIKVYNHSDYDDWKNYYSVFTAILVRIKFRKDIKTFGYKDDFKSALKTAIANRKFI